jgi:hypothetical protein
MGRCRTTADKGTYTLPKFRIGNRVTTNNGTVMVVVRIIPYMDTYMYDLEHTTEHLGLGGIYHQGEISLIK